MIGCDLAAREAGRVGIYLPLFSVFERGALNPDSQWGFSGAVRLGGKKLAIVVERT